MACRFQDQVMEVCCCPCLGALCWGCDAGGTLWGGPCGEELKRPASSHWGELGRVPSRARPAVPGTRPRPSRAPQRREGVSAEPPSLGSTALMNSQVMIRLFEAGSVGVTCYAAVGSCCMLRQGWPVHAPVHTLSTSLS